MRLKALEAWSYMHGGPPGWLEKSYPVGGILYVMDGPYRMPFTRTLSAALIKELPWRELMEFPADVCYIIMNTTIRHGLCHARKAWPGTLLTYAFSLAESFQALINSIVSPHDCLYNVSNSHYSLCLNLTFG